MLFLIKMLLGYEFWAGVFVGVVLKDPVMSVLKWGWSKLPMGK